VGSGRCRFAELVGAGAVGQSSVVVGRKVCRVSSSVPPRRPLRPAARIEACPLPAFVPFQLSQPVEKPPSGLQWLHEIKLDGYRMAARIDNGRARLFTRIGLDLTAKYPSTIAALEHLKVKTAYIDGELCGVDEAGLPSFAQTQAATDGERDVHLVFAPSIFCTWRIGTSRSFRSSNAKRCLSVW
jgi:ATP-dependent DNA ligase